VKAVDHNESYQIGAVRFSILVPVYNTERYLVECIQSVLAQTYQNFELLLVNDGSEDSSGRICDEYAKKHDKIRVYHKMNGGQLHARKCAADQASGEYCIYLDSDDCLETNALERINKAIEKTHCDCIIFGMSRVKDGNVIKVIRDQEEKILVDKRELYRKCFLSDEYNPMCRKAVRLSLVQGRDYPEWYYRIRHGEDLLQSLDVLKECGCAAVIRDVLYKYRIHAQSITQAVRYESFTTDNSVRARVLSFLREENVFTESDYEEYRIFCIQLMAKKVWNIAGLDISTKKKIELFDALKKSDYYKGFIHSGKYDRKKLGKRGLIYELFQRDHYRMLIGLFSVKRRVRAFIGRLEKGRNG